MECSTCTIAGDALSYYSKNMLSYSSYRSMIDNADTVCWSDSAGGHNNIPQQLAQSISAAVWTLLNVQK